MNLEDRLAGQLDSPLTTEGAADARILEHRLRNVPLNAVHCSGLVRTIESARPLAASRCMPLQIWRDLNERNYGDLAGMPIQELRESQTLKGLVEAPTMAPTNGESWVHVKDRALGRIKSILELADGNVAIVTHGGPIRAFMDELGYHGRGYGGDERIPHGLVAQFEFAPEIVREEGLFGGLTIAHTLSTAEFQFD